MWPRWLWILDCGFWGKDVAQTAQDKAWCWGRRIKPDVDLLVRQQGVFNWRLPQLRCNKTRYRMSFLPAAIPAICNDSPLCQERRLILCMMHIQHFICTVRAVILSRSIAVYKYIFVYTVFSTYLLYLCFIFREVIRVHSVWKCCCHFKITFLA